MQKKKEKERKEKESDRGLACVVNQTTFYLFKRKVEKGKGREKGKERRKGKWEVKLWQNRKKIAITPQPEIEPGALSKHG